MSSRTRRSRRALIAAALLPLSACTTAADHTDPVAKSAPGFPYTVTNCGVKTTYQAPPERVVTMNQHVTEVMLELGLARSLVGTAYLDDQVLPKYAKEYKATPVLAKEYPSYEKLLAANPDFVYGGYASAFSAGDGRSRETLKKSGISSRLNMEYCAKDKTSMDALYREIGEVGRTFGVRDRAQRWIADAKAGNAATVKKLKGVDPVSVFVYDGGDQSASTVGGAGIGDEMITRAGGKNVFGHLPKPFTDVSWEDLVDRRPETIVILDYGSVTVEQKKKRLLDDPVLAGIPAVKNKRFAVLPLSDMVLGVRAPAAVDTLARQIHPELKK
ncbi:ABC transporter substrate-binding protein [Streptomyces hypolithicus]